MNAIEAAANIIDQDPARLLIEYIFIYLIGERYYDNLFARHDVVAWPLLLVI